MVSTNVYLPDNKTGMEITFRKLWEGSLPNATPPQVVQSDGIYVDGYVTAALKRKQKQKQKPKWSVELIDLPPEEF